MAKKARQIVAVLLTALLVNALCWSVSPDAFADWISNEESAAAEQPDTVKKSAVSGEHSQKTEKSCNEGCHACCHFHGLNFVTFHYSPSARPEAVSLPQKISAGVALRHPRRPPRTLSLV